MRQLIKAEVHQQSSKMFFFNVLRQKIDFFCIIYASSMGSIENCGKESVCFLANINNTLFSYYFILLSQLSLNLVFVPAIN
jgi:hypothetical protein